MIKITQENRTDIIKSYCHELLNNMDFDTLYSFAHYMLVDNKESLNNHDLELEIMNYSPHVLDDFEKSSVSV
jgi:hypothetical protein